MALVPRVRRTGRSALGLVVVLAIGLGAGAAVVVQQRPGESRAAVQRLLGSDAGGGGSGEARREDSTEAVAALPPAPDMPRKGAPPPPASPEPDEGSGLTGDVEVPENLSGVLRAASGRERAPGDGEVLRVRVATERGLPVDRQVFADAVMETLNDPRGWSSVDGVTFARTDGDDHDLEVVLAGPDTTDELCAPLDTGGSLSCGVVGMAVLNFARWAHGSDAWENTARYRQYLVNHEVGHVIGHRHDECAGPGRKATVMVQQTRSAQGCVPEPWPAPGRGGN